MRLLGVIAALDLCACAAGVQRSSTVGRTAGTAGAADITIAVDSWELVGAFGTTNVHGHAGFGLGRVRPHQAGMTRLELGTVETSARVSLGMSAGAPVGGVILGGFATFATNFGTNRSGDEILGAALERSLELGVEVRPAALRFGERHRGASWPYARVGVARQKAALEGPPTTVEDVDAFVFALGWVIGGGWKR